MAEQGSDQRKSEQRSSPEKSQREIDRRKFVQRILASMPAVGIACAVPMIASGGEKQIRWACRIDELFGGLGWSLYAFLDCTNQEILLMADVPGLPFGDCANPSDEGCVRMPDLNSLAKSQDSLAVYSSPKLSQASRADFERAKSFLLYNFEYGTNS